VKILLTSKPRNFQGPRFVELSERTVLLLVALQEFLKAGIALHGTEGRIGVDRRKNAETTIERLLEGAERLLFIPSAGIVGAQPVGIHHALRLAGLEDGGNRVRVAARRR
jgi:hypothetical protein